MTILQETLKVWDNNHGIVQSYQGEAGSRILEITFVGKVTPVDLTGCTPRIYVHNGANPEPFYNGTIVDAVGGVADFVITSDMVKYVGDWPIQFLLSGENYAPLKADGLILHVLSSNLENSQESTNTFGALEIALNKANAAADTATQAAADAQVADEKANDVLATAAKAKEASDAATQEAKDAANTAKQAAQDALNSHSMISPITHYTEPIEKVINDLFTTMSALGSGAPTAAEYAALGLTTEQYAAKHLTAAQYAINGKSLLGG